MITPCAGRASHIKSIANAAPYFDVFLLPRCNRLWAARRWPPPSPSPRPSFGRFANGGGGGGGGGGGINFGGGGGGGGSGGGSGGGGRFSQVSSARSVVD